MTIRAFVSRATLMLALLVPAAAAIADPRFACTPSRPANGTFHELRIAGGTEVSPQAINNRGDIVGSYRDAQGAVHGFLLRDGALTTIHVPNSNTTAAVDINNDGVITGFFDGHGFILRRGAFTMIDAPGAFETQPIGINDRGVVVGLALEPNASDGTQVGFVRQRDGSFERIVVEGHASTLVADINNRGTLLINTDTEQRLRVDGRDTPMTPCATETVVGITNGKAVFGLTEDASLGMFVGFARNAKGTRTYRYPGSIQTIVRDRNAAHAAVGEATLPDVGQIGFVFIPR